MMKTHLLGFPRIGAAREIKKACEQYWRGKITLPDLAEAGKRQKRYNWQLQQEAGIDLIPCNDFSLYDQVLDMVLITGAVPERYGALESLPETDLYFAMARGYQQNGLDVTAMEMTKWFDTNYHYIVPEFTAAQSFRLRPHKPLEEFLEAKELGIAAKPVLIGPVSFLLLGKEKEGGFHRLDLLDRLLPVYSELLQRLAEAGADWVQLDEPFLVTALDQHTKKAFQTAYTYLKEQVPALKLLLATYFEGLHENTSLACSLGIDALHIDLVRAPGQLKQVLNRLPASVILSAGIVDGRNIWKNDFARSLTLLSEAEQLKTEGRLWIAPSCSLLHVPFDLELESDTRTLPEAVKNWIAFAKQKVREVATIASLASRGDHAGNDPELLENRHCIEERRNSSLITNQHVQQALASVSVEMTIRNQPFRQRKQLQQEKLKLPLFPTTTIGSFPQTKEIRELRSRLNQGAISRQEYTAIIRAKTADLIRKQEEIGLDVLVHGEFERNDMVQYFGEQLEGFAFTQNGWVQSYGSRAVKPPLIFGDVSRPRPMTVEMAGFAMQQTSKPVKGMLTGPVTILQWSFVRDDQPREETAFQIALAIRKEVLDLERSGVPLIQIDEPALREGLPLRREQWKSYLDWAVNAFRLASSGVDASTQVHTHMCYSEFNDIIEAIGKMDADVITIETSRSQMELLEAFAGFAYPNEIGPGIYDIHSPRIPAEKEMEALMDKALDVIPAEQLWVNPDCGLKTRDWPETEAALRNMVSAARKLRARYASVSRM
ncbi:5-methyltetrahydropteroyltriglutamate--homocysteine S-methyltransferase [Anseongella ginsenosidimutans]|nr:5-methyltetrahydropteroyltriglutamate--homocysteine S-methyltransferase [Anseongella ginsenosidimutans]